MTNDELLALCAFEEANLEPDDGLAAVVRVVLNRMRLKYQSDGTVPGTVLAGNGAAFSWVGFAMVDGKYTRIASGRTALERRAAGLLTRAQTYAAPWARALRISAEVQGGAYRGALYDQLTDATVLYLNLSIVPRPPAWADLAKRVCVIGHHTFYHA